MPSFQELEEEENFKEPVPRNFVINKDPYHHQPPPPPPPPSSGLEPHAVPGIKQPPPPPPLRTRPSGINGRLKPSDSSFGLHSPDNLPVGFNPQDDKVQVKTRLRDHVLP